MNMKGSIGTNKHAKRRSSNFVRDVQPKESQRFLNEIEEIPLEMIDSPVSRRKMSDELRRSLMKRKISDSSRGNSPNIMGKKLQIIDLMTNDIDDLDEQIKHNN